MSWLVNHSKYVPLEAAIPYGSLMSCLITKISIATHLAVAEETGCRGLTASLGSYRPKDARGFQSFGSTEFWKGIQ
jgi:hypothetical protein